MAADRRREHRLDLLQLDAEAADLDLEIAAAGELDAAAGQEAAEVAGFVEPVARVVRPGIGEELLAGLLRVGITDRQVARAEADLAQLADAGERAARAAHQELHPASPRPSGRIAFSRPRLPGSGKVSSSESNPKWRGSSRKERARWVSVAP